MTLSVSKREDFLNNFLVPVSKISENAVLKIREGSIQTLIATADNTIIVLGSYIDPLIKGEYTLNVPDIKKFTRVIACIQTEDLNLEIGPNTISYKSSAVRFKYHLFDEGIISVPKLNVDKIKTLEYDGKFTLLPKFVTSLVKGSSIATETNKFYISVKDAEVLGELTDKSRDNVDSYGIAISADYSGVQFATPIAFNFDIIRTVASIKFIDVKAQLVTKLGVMLLDLNLDNTSLQFIVSALAK